MCVKTPILDIQTSISGGDIVGPLCTDQLTKLNCPKHGPFHTFDHITSPSTFLSY